MHTLTPKQCDVLKALRHHPVGLSPTKIGEACGKPYYGASAWASSALKSLQARGYVSRQKRYGTVLYSLTESGRVLAKELAS